MGGMGSVGGEVGEIEFVVRGWLGEVGVIGNGREVDEGVGEVVGVLMEEVEVVLGEYEVVGVEFLVIGIEDRGWLWRGRR